MTEDELRRIEDREAIRFAAETRNRLDVQIATARNVATNGRLFCLMVFAVALTTFACGHGSAFGVLAAVSAMPVGASAIVDQMPDSAARRVASIATYALAACLCLFVIIAIG